MEQPPPPSPPANHQHNPEPLFSLWDELSNFGLHRQQEALKHCMSRICQWIGADHAVWLGTVRMMRSNDGHSDLLRGWRIGAIVLLNDTSPFPAQTPLTLNKPLQLDPGATNLALIAGVGRFRAYRLHGGELVNVEQFMQSDHYDFYYRQAGICDRIWVIFPINDDVESVFCFDTYGDKRYFSDSNCELAAMALRGIKWFHRQQLLSNGLGLCEEPLSEAERAMIPTLLTGASEKEIAQQLALTPGTVHQYATRIYRKFGVNGRTSFMSLWLA